jgi:hypothetical protein
VNEWAIAALAFVAGAAAGSGGTYTFLKKDGRIIPKPSAPVKK